MVYSTYKKQRIIQLSQMGHKAPTICKLLQIENLTCTRKCVHAFLKRYALSQTIERKPGSSGPSKITSEVKDIVENQMRLNDETSALQLHRLLQSYGYKIHRRTILRCRTSLGWTFRGSAYCQLIRDVNKQKRLDWAQLNMNDSFDDVIWTDESSIQMESHRRFCCRKRGEAARPKPRYLLRICTHIHSYTFIDPFTSLQAKASDKGARVGWN